MVVIITVDEIDYKVLAIIAQVPIMKCVRVFSLNMIVLLPSTNVEEKRETRYTICVKKNDG